MTETAESVPTPETGAQPALPPPSRTDLIAMLVLSFGFLVLYLMTLCRTVYFGDSGEIALTIWAGGIIHPPGYPLFGLLGRIALMVVPTGEPAFRIGCLVALAAALAVGVTYRLCREIGASVLSAIAAAATFGLGYSFWSQSARVEVYSLHVLLSALTLWRAMAYRKSGKLSDILTACLCLSLGLAHHLTILMMLPGLLIIAGARLWTDKGLPARLALAVPLTVLVGPLFYFILLPLWAKDSTLHNWGDPKTLPAVLNHMSAKIYQGNFRVGPLPELLQVTGLALKLFADNFLYVGVVLPIAGAVLHGRKDKAVAVGLYTIALTVLVYNLCYRIDDIAGYYLVLWLIGALWTSLAWDAFQAALNAPGRRPLLVPVLAVTLPVALLLRNYVPSDLSRATFVHDFARDKLISCDKDAVLITTGDQDVNPILYVHEVLNVRPDVIPIDRDYVDGAWLLYEQDPSQWYLRRLQLMGVEQTIPENTTSEQRGILGRDQYLISLLTGPLKGRPIFATFAKMEAARKDQNNAFLQWRDANFLTLPQGIVLKFHPKSQPLNLAELTARNKAFWDTAELPILTSIRTDQEFNPSYITDHYTSMLLNYGGLYEQMSDKKTAAMVYKAALDYAPNNPAVHKAIEDLGPPPGSSSPPK